MGISLTVYNGKGLSLDNTCAIQLCLAAPVELLSLYIDAPWLLVLNDFRQGVLVASLFSFWIILVGEHKRAPQEVNLSSSVVQDWFVTWDFQEKDHTGHIGNYWKEMGVVSLSCIFFFVYEFCER